MFHKCATNKKTEIHISNKQYNVDKTDKSWKSFTVASEPRWIHVSGKNNVSEESKPMKNYTERNEPLCMRRSWNIIRVMARKFFFTSMTNDLS